MEHTIGCGHSRKPLALTGPALLLSSPLLLLASPALAGPPAATVQVLGTPSTETIVTIRPLSGSASRQGLKQFVGISGANSGSRGLSMNRVVIPPGGRAAPHRHVGSESAIYLVSGRVKTFFGPCLERTVINQAGDFLYIPPGVPHMPQNLSSREPAIAIVSRTDAEEQEHVELIGAPGRVVAPGRVCSPGQGPPSW